MDGQQKSKIGYKDFNIDFIKKESHIRQRLIRYILSSIRGSLRLFVVVVYDKYQEGG